MSSPPHPPATAVHGLSTASSPVGSPNLDVASALFGYSGRVELLTRAPGQAWQTEVLFVDRDKGHWLCAGEFDGRNNTLEIFASGYGGRIVMLSRGAD